MQGKVDYRSKTSGEIEIIVLSYGNVLVQLPTGYGKTLIAIKNIAKHLDTGKFLFCVPKVDLIANAQKDFIKHGFSHLIERGDFICYASAHNYVGKNYDIIVLDEIHNAVSDLRTSSIEQINAPYVIGLSATIDEETRELLNNIRPQWYDYKKTLQQAFSEGVLKKPEIVYIDVHLDNKIARNKFKLYNNKEVIYTDRQYYEALCSSITYWRERFQQTGEPFAANKMKSLGKQRQTFLADCKEEAVKQLIQSLGNNRFICFCGSVAQAKRLGPKETCSSHTSKKGNEELIEKFNSKEINRLFAKDMLKEGTNLIDTDYGILIQPGNKEKDFIQMLGRTLRSANPIFYIFRAVDTVDSRFLQNSTKQLS